MSTFEKNQALIAAKVPGRSMMDIIMREIGNEEDERLSYIFRPEMDSINIRMIKFYGFIEANYIICPMDSTFRPHHVAGMLFYDQIQSSFKFEGPLVGAFRYGEDGYFYLRLLIFPDRFPNILRRANYYKLHEDSTDGAVVKATMDFLL